MKKLLMLTLLLFPSVLFAHETIYKGQGEWNDSNGDSGTYTSMTHKTHDENGKMTISKTITWDGQSKNMIYNVTKGENDFLVVSNSENAVMGSGYYYACDAAKLIHLDFSPREGVRVEKTIKANLDGYKEMGSMTDEAPEEGAPRVLTFREHAKRIYPLED